MAVLRNSSEVLVAVKCTGIFIPGIASCETLSSGNLKLWMTSLELKSTRIFLSTGI